MEAKGPEKTYTKKELAVIGGVVALIMVLLTSGAISNQNVNVAIYGGNSQAGLETPTESDLVDKEDVVNALELIVNVDEDPYLRYRQ